MQIHGYRRVSSRVQLDNNSLEVQLDTLTRYANWKFPDQQMIDYCDPAVSATIPWFERPEGERMWLALLPGDHILVPTFDRAFRSVGDLCKTIAVMEQRKVTLHCIDFGIDFSSSIGKLIGHILASVKEYERLCFIDRIKSVNTWKKSKKIPHQGSRPCGWKMTGTGQTAKLIPWPEERRLAYYCLWLKEQEGMTRDKIYLRCWHEGRIGYKGCPFPNNHMYVEKLIQGVRAEFPDEFGDKIPALVWEIECRPPTKDECCARLSTVYRNGDDHPKIRAKLRKAGKLAEQTQQATYP